MDWLWLLVAAGTLLVLIAGYAIRRSRRKALPAPEEKPKRPEPLEKPGEIPQEAPEKALPAAVPEKPALAEPGEKPPEPAPVEAPAETPPAEKPPAPDTLFSRLVKGLSRTQAQFVARLDAVFRGRKEIDESLYEELEAVLITADIGVRTTQRLLDEMREQVDRDALHDPTALREFLKTRILRILERDDVALRDTDQPPLVILVVGVNGTGKTTTIGKLAARFTAQGKKVILAAGDTFRAAAIEQLEIWAERAGADIVKNKEGADPASVIYDALQAAKARGADVVIADTAGRLHTKVSLMEELKKVRRVIGKAIPGAPHEVLLVLDATMGQNALAQARVFHQGTSLTGLVLTKLDGTAKGGIVIAIVNELDLPVKFIGVGEKIEDLQPFDPERFVSALF